MCAAVLTGESRESCFFDISVPFFCLSLVVFHCGEFAHSVQWICEWRVTFKGTWVEKTIAVDGIEEKMFTKNLQKIIWELVNTADAQASQKIRFFSPTGLFYRVEKYWIILIPNPHPQFLVLTYKSKDKYYIPVRYRNYKFFFKNFSDSISK